MTSNLVLGALVADAAALGLHWLYDPARITQIAEANGTSAFIAPDAANFADVPGVFVHQARENGQQTQYGDTLMLALRNCADGGFGMARYQDAFVKHFGAGGTFNGYIDAPTRGTLANLAAEQTDPSGVDDKQHPALSTLPAVVWAHAASPDLNNIVTQAIEVTNVHANAAKYGPIAVQMMLQLSNGESLTQVLENSGETDALAIDSSDSTAYGETTGRACYLASGVPLSVHILKHATSYHDAIERNIRAGGDSAGRAMLIGALAGQNWGVGGETGIPLNWLTRTKAAQEATALMGV